MCGTSGDGVSAALVETEGYGKRRRVRMLAHTVYAYPDELRRRLFRLFPPHQFSVEELAFLHRDFGELLADVALEIILHGCHSPADVTGIAVQAPTIFHGPPSVDRTGVHMEIGEAAIIAERTGAPVVCDLRPSDVAAGGHGAPLSAYADYVLFVDPAKGRAIQNIGGIANVTFVSAAATLDDVLAFDTGPGNMVIDGVVQQLTDGQTPFDKDGRRAAQGSVHGGLLTELMQHPYLAQHPPKTTGREDFGESFVTHVLERARRLKLPHDDIVATVTAYTAECIGLHYQRELIPRSRIDEMIVYGGGAHNKTLLRLIQERVAPIRVRHHEEFGISGDAREAVTWAILGDETMAGHAGNVPSASGARHRVVLGKMVDVRPRIEE
jgi:anhydro-N-acetylmuramic acid kinase